MLTSALRAIFGKRGIGHSTPERFRSIRGELGQFRGIEGDIGKYEGDVDHFWANLASSGDASTHARANLVGCPRTPQSAVGLEVAADHVIAAVDGNAAALEVDAAYVAAAAQQIAAAQRVATAHGVAAAHSIAAVPPHCMGSPQALG